MTGRVHSVQSLGAVDGPGLRYVVFLQGCPLRCAYCHNPDTWDFQGGTETEAAALVRKILRYRPYFQNGGGVTVTGGEPLSQAAFVAELFEALQAEGIHTALDTSGVCRTEEAKQVLKHTDLVLADLKFITKEDYLAHCKADFGRVEAFLSLTEQMGIPLWIRHVVVPGLTDGAAHLAAVKQKAESYRNLEKIEWLPFRTLCLEKYDKMGIPFPLKTVPDMSQEALDRKLRRLA